MDWKDVLRKLAPVAASAIAGPMGGGIVAALGGIFGIDEPSQDKIAQAIESGSLTSEQVAALRTLEMKLKAEEQERGFRYADLEFKDREGARDRDAGITASGGHNWRADIMSALAVGVICWLVYSIWKDPTINEFMKGIITLVLGRFLGYLDSIYNFEFGRNRSGELKDNTINQLSAK